MTFRACIPFCLLLVTARPGGLVAQIRDEAPPARRPATATATTAPTAPTPAAALPADTSEVRRLRAENAALKLKMPDDSLAQDRYRRAVNTAKWVLGGWFILVLLYLFWAIHRYVYNYGLSNREWKILYPEIYETWLDRLMVKFHNLGVVKFFTGGAKSFEQRRTDLMTYRRTNRALDETSTGDGLPVTRAATPIQPFEEPDENPYQHDSFGLPPGTIRGILALTALVMFLIVEGVNLHSPASLEGQFDGLVTVFQMVIAFYFGSRAVEVLQAKTSEAAKNKAAADEARAPASATAPAATSDTAVAEPAPATSKLFSGGGVEKVLLPEGSATTRFANVVALSKDGGAAPATAAAGKLASLPLATRVLTLTASFETGRGYPGCFGTIAGNFDGQAISFGALQWNIGQGTLQPLWKEMRDKHPDDLKRLLGDSLYDEFCQMLDSDKDAQRRWALDIQFPVSNRKNQWKIADNWQRGLQELGTSPPMINIQVNRAASLFAIALGFCKEYQVTRERGAALMFDIRVQNGSVDRNGSGQRMREDFELINPTLSADEQEIARMEIIARRRADESNPIWREDVFNRKVTIARGQGIVHGRRFDLEKDFAIGLGPMSGAAGPGVGGPIA